MLKKRGGGSHSFARQVGVKTCIGTQDIIQNTLPKTSPNRNASSLDLYTGAVKRLCVLRAML